MTPGCDRTRGGGVVVSVITGPLRLVMRTRSSEGALASLSKRLPGELSAEHSQTECQTSYAADVCRK